MSSNKNVGRFSLHYYGPAFENNSMSIKDLAPALLHFSDAVDEAKNLIDTDAKIDLKVTATQPGSFNILMNIAQFANSPSGQALAWLATIGGGIGISGIIVGAVKYAQKHIGKKKPKVIDKKAASQSADKNDNTLFTQNDNFVTIENPDGSHETYHEKSIEIAGDQKFVENIGQALHGPAQNNAGVQGAVLSSKGKKQQQVDVPVADSARLASWASPDKVLQEGDNTLTVQPLDAHFEEGKKWRVTTGEGTVYTVSVDDPRFVRAYENGLRIGRWDTLKVKMHFISYQRSNGRIRTDYSISKVISYTPFHAEQGELGI